jgi:hypothetical protein
MVYVCVPPTVARACDENRAQRARLLQWQNELAKYPILCPQLSGPIAELQNILNVLRKQIALQEELIRQRIQLQAAITHPELVSTKLAPQTSNKHLTDSTSLRIPSLDNKINQAATRLQTRPHIRLRPRSLEQNIINIHNSLVFCHQKATKTDNNDEQNRHDVQAKGSQVRKSAPSQDCEATVCPPSPTLVLSKYHSLRKSSQRNSIPQLKRRRTKFFLQDSKVWAPVP